MIVFISGIYYSITVFPQWVQSVSHAFPVVYVLEGMRSVFMGNTAAGIGIFARGYAVAVIWLLISLVLIRRMENYARKSGFYEKYG
jgi:ABC-2 type transport system permease protein